MLVNFLLNAVTIPKNTGAFLSNLLISLAVVPCEPNFGILKFTVFEIFTIFVFCICVLLIPCSWQLLTQFRFRSQGSMQICQEQSREPSNFLKESTTINRAFPPSTVDYPWGVNLSSLSSVWQKSSCNPKVV